VDMFIKENGEGILDRVMDFRSLLMDVRILDITGKIKWMVWENTSGVMDKYIKVSG